MTPCLQSHPLDRMVHRRKSPVSAGHEFHFPIQAKIILSILTYIIVHCGLLLSNASAARPAESPLPPPLIDDAVNDPSLNIQRRSYDPSHELNIGIGTLPTDPYHAGYTAQLDYTFHMNQIFAFSTFGAYNLSFDKHLKDEVRAQRIATLPTLDAFPEIEFFGGASLLYRPLYGKLATDLGTTQHVEFFLHSGICAAWVLDVPKPELQLKEPALLLGGHFGLGIRLWLNPQASLRFDAKEMLYVAPQGIIHALHLQVGFALNLERQQ
jgi:hypothetical protein